MCQSENRSIAGDQIWVTNNCRCMHTPQYVSLLWHWELGDKNYWKNITCTVGQPFKIWTTWDLKTSIFFTILFEGFGTVLFSVFNFTKIVYFFKPIRNRLELWFLSHVKNFFVGWSQCFFERLASYDKYDFYYKHLILDVVKYVGAATLPHHWS